MAHAMRIEPFVISPDSETPSTPGARLELTAKRYTPVSGDRGEGLTLLFTHCVGSHKEQWEPTIARVLELQNSPDAIPHVREAWSFDWQNHGDAALLNRDALKSLPKGVPVAEWARALANFVLSPRMQGHRIVPIGHSAGGTAWILSTKLIPPSQLPYVAVVLAEPTMVTKKTFEAELNDRMAEMDFVVKSTSVRRDTWRSKDEAFTWMSKRFPWAMWDPRAVRLLCEHGLSDSRPVSQSVTLKCAKEQEAASYPDVEAHWEGAAQLGRICSNVPIHIIWGDRNDLVPSFIQDSLSDASEGRHVASVGKIEDAGHMVVQEKPEAVAEAICRVLRGTASRARSRM